MPALQPLRKQKIKRQRSENSYIWELLYSEATKQGNFWTRRLHFEYGYWIDILICGWWIIFRL